MSETMARRTPTLESILDLNALPWTLREQIYVRLCPEELLARFGVNRSTLLNGTGERTLRIAAERGEIDVLHPLGDGPWIFKRADLEGPAAQALALRVRSNPRYPHGIKPEPTRSIPINNIGRCAF